MLRLGAFFAAMAARRTRAPVVAAAIALVALLAVGGVAAWWFLLRPKPVYVNVRTQPVWTNPQALDDSALSDAMVENMKAATRSAPNRTVWALEEMTTEYTDRGAAVSEATSSGLSMVYSLDEKGNPIAARGTGNEWTESRTYDEHDRVVRTVRPDGMRAEYAYADDGSCTFEMFDGSGSQLAKSVYAAEGNWLFSEYYWEGGGLQARYDYEGGFLSHATFYDENGSVQLDTTFVLERDAQGRVSSVSSPDGSWPIPTRRPSTLTVSALSTTRTAAFRGCTPRGRAPRSARSSAPSTARCPTRTTSSTSTTSTSG